MIDHDKLIEDCDVEIDRLNAELEARWDQDPSKEEIRRRVLLGFRGRGLVPEDEVVAALAEAGIWSAEDQEIGLKIAQTARLRQLLLADRDSVHGDEDDEDDDGEEWKDR